VNPERHDDLDWLAFRYVADELAPDKAAAFEERLAHDPEACNAVARAVELIGAIAGAGCEAPTATRPRVSVVVAGPQRAADRARSRWLVWVAVAAAAVLAVAVSLPWLGSDKSGSQPVERAVAPDEGFPDANEDSPAELALLWSETRDELAALDEEVWPPEPTDPSDGAEDEDDGDLIASLDATDEVPEVPSWMEAAIAGLEGSPGGGNPTSEPSHEG
jgi:hypothetical protein